MYSGLDRVRVPQVIDELFLARSEENPSSLTDQRRMLMQKLDPDPASRRFDIQRCDCARLHGSTQPHCQGQR